MTERGRDRDRQKVTGGKRGREWWIEAAREEEKRKKEGERCEREKGGEGEGERRSWRLLTEAERKMGGEAEGSCRWTV